MDQAEETSVWLNNDPMASEYLFTLGQVLGRTIFVGAQKEERKDKANKGIQRIEYFP
jgi:hypothetical protein